MRSRISIRGCVGLSIGPTLKIYITKTISEGIEVMKNLQTVFSSVAIRLPLLMALVRLFTQMRTPKIVISQLISVISNCMRTHHRPLSLVFMQRDESFFSWIEICIKTHTKMGFWSVLGNAFALACRLHGATLAYGRL